VTPDKVELKRVIYAQELALMDAARQQVAAARADVTRQQWALARISPQAAFNNYRQQLDTLVNRAGRTVQHYLSLQQERVKTLSARLDTLDPQATLARGYAIVQKEQLVVTQTAQVSQDDEIVVKVSDGEFGAKVSPKVRLHPET
ncbi:MAG: hypothetical protein KJ077_38670, partial [Anaerolineae bacterium]|nr:hypothetical protein [Anaerolineae bacterium]